MKRQKKRLKSFKQFSCLKTLDNSGKDSTNTLDKHTEETLENNCWASHLLTKVYNEKHHQILTTSHKITFLDYTNI